MNIYYQDILKRIDTPPLWFDEAAVPRYDPFTPRACDIYADEAALVLILCQSCHHPFFVAFSSNKHRKPLRSRIESGYLHYGDPPNIACCASGPTMNCEEIHVMGFFHRPKYKWERDQSLEVPLADFSVFTEELPQAPMSLDYE